MKRGGPTHPKTFELAERLGVQWPYAVGTLEILFHFTSQYAPEGNIGRFSDKRIAAGLGWRGKPEKLIGALVESGWVDRHATERLAVHDWQDHLDQGTLRKLDRAGKKPIQQNHMDSVKMTSHPKVADASLPLPVPLPVPEPHTTAVPDGDFNEWLAPWPRCASPDLAAGAWVSTVEQPSDRDGAFATRDRYLASDEVARGVVMDPAKFLFQQKAAGWRGKWPTNGGQRKGPDRLTDERLAEIDAEIARGVR